MSQASIEGEKGVEVHLSSIMKSLPFYKFRDAHIPSFCLLTFLIVFLFSILSVNIIATMSIKSLQDRVSILDKIYARLRVISSMGRDTGFIHMYNYLFGTPFDPNILIIHQNLYKQSTLLANHNTKLEELVSKLDTKTKLSFYEKNIRVFFSDYGNIPNTPDYQLMDSFDAINSLISKALFFYQKYYDFFNPQRYDALEFLFGNSNNDLWIQSVNLPSIVLEDMESKVEGLVSKNSSAFISAAIMLGIFSLTLIIFIFKSFVDTKEFLNLFINYSSSAIINSALANIDFYRGFVNRKIQGKDNIIHIKAERSRSKVDKFGWRNGNTSTLFASLMRKLVLLLSFLAVPFALMWRSYTIIDKNASNIIPTINDVVSINEIVIHGSKTYLGVSVYISRNDSVRFMNSYVRDLLDAEIEYISYTISKEKRFLEKTEKFLHTNICNHYVKVEGDIPPCESLLKGVGVSGIVPSMISFQNVMRSLKIRLDAVASLLDLYYVIIDPDYFECFFIINVAISLSVEAFQEELVNELIRELDNVTHHTIVLFILGVIFGSMMCIAIGVIIYGSIWKDRKKTSETLQILPLELVMTNKHLKSYLLKEVPQFYKIVKKYENSKNNESLLEEKIIKANQEKKKG